METFSRGRMFSGIKPSSNRYVGVNSRKPSPLSNPSHNTRFEQVILPHLDAAYNLARWLTANDQDAQDVVQEACLRAFRAFAGFHGENGRAWLLTIVRNTAYTTLQRHRASPQMTALNEELHGEIGSLQGEGTTPTTAMQRMEDKQRIDEAIAALPDEFREAIVLRHQDGLSYKEIAEIACVPTGTVMSRLARARARLRQVLAPDQQVEASS